jgi:hypothetical protein
MVLWWKAYLRVNDEAAGRKLLFRLQECLGTPMTLGDLGRDDEDQSVYRCTFTTELGSVRPQDVAHAALAAAGRLAPSWEVGGLPPDGSLWGVATQGIAVSGVTWLHFSLGE